MYTYVLRRTGRAHSHSLTTGLVYGTFRFDAKRRVTWRWLSTKISSWTKYSKSCLESWIVDFSPLESECKSKLSEIWKLSNYPKLRKVVLPGASHLFTSTKRLNTLLQWTLTLIQSSSYPTEPVILSQKILSCILFKSLRATAYRTIDLHGTPLS